MYLISIRSVDLGTSQRSKKAFFEHTEALKLDLCSTEGRSRRASVSAAETPDRASQISPAHRAMAMGYGSTCVKRQLHHFDVALAIVDLLQLLEDVDRRVAGSKSRGRISSFLTPPLHRLTSYG